MNVIGIIQARLTSKRFPGKVLKKIGNMPMLEILIKRISFSKKLDKIIVVIPRSKKNKNLKIFLKKKKLLITKVMKKMFYSVIILQQRNTQLT